MKKLFLYILLCINVLYVTAQDIEIFGGINKNYFFDFEKENPHFRSEYFSDYGYSLGLSISKLKFDSIPIRLSVIIDNYKGKLKITSGGLGYSQTTEAEVEKTTIGLLIYPLNLNILKNGQINLGALFTYKINFKSSGNFTSWSIGDPYIYEEKLIKIKNNDFIFGINGRASYDLKIMNNWYISPQYKFYIGLTNEFKDLQTNVKSLRHIFEISIKKKI
ncbi:MAG: hypothetical protein K8R54_17715 [Bacteroidales bacterium]|nr:hypothetical protein [Bacteroidales bacterium]